MENQYLKLKKLKMKKYLFLFKNNLLLITSVCLLLLVSCKKEKNDGTVGNEVTQLEFTVAGVEDPSNVLVKLGSTNSNTVSDLQNISVPSVVKFGNNGEIESYVKLDAMDDIMEKNHVSESKANTKLKTKLAANSKLQTDKTYRILLKNTATQVFERSVLVTVGQNITIDVQKGVAYDWFAYSYNNTDNIIDPLLNNNFDIETPIDKDLLYAKGTTPISTNSTNTAFVPITFKHKLALVTFQMYSQLLANELVSVEAELDVLGSNNVNNYFNKAQFSLLTGAIVPGTVQPYTAQSLSFTVVDPTNPVLWESSGYYTTDPSNLSAIKIKLNRIITKEPSNGQTVELPNLPTTVTFNYSSPTVGKKIIGRVDLKNIFPQMYVLSGDTIYASIPASYAAASWHLYTLGAGAGGVVGYAGRTQFASTDILLWNRRYTYDGSAGFMRSAFAPEAPVGTSNAIIYKQYYTTGKIKVQDEVISDMFETKATVASRNPEWGDKYTLAKKLVPGKARPDVIIISLARVHLTEADNDALINYVKNDHGVVLILSDRGDPRYSAGTNVNSHLSVKKFMKEIFGSGIDIGEIATSSNTAYKMKEDINDPIINGFYGDLRKSYWGARRNISYVTGLNQNDIINYSENVAANVNIGTPPANSSIMFRHKTHNVFWIGDGEFIAKTSNELTTTSAYQTYANNGMGTPWMYPLTSTVYGASYPLDNAKIFGNFMVWAFSQRRGFH